MRSVAESVGSNFRIDETWTWRSSARSLVLENARRAQPSGGELRYAEIVTYRGGRIILIEHFREAEALKAVGLEE